MDNLVFVVVSVLLGLALGKFISVVTASNKEQTSRILGITTLIVVAVSVLALVI